MDDVYLTLSASEAENLFFWYVIMREPTQDFERNFAKWATELRSIKSDEELDAFIVARFDKAKADLVNRFDDSMGRLALRSLQLYRFQYVLAKLTQQVDLLAYGETEGTRWLGNYVSGGYEVEHIFPQTPGAEAAAEFGPVSDPEVVQRLGNLVLVEKSINTSLGNRPYSEKRQVYQQSKLLLTRALSERPKVGTNTRIDRAVASIEPFSAWNEGAVQQRQRSLSRSLALSGAFLNTGVQLVESGGARKLKTSLISFAENRNANLRRGGWP